MTPQRVESIDRFRGFAILTMVLANYMGGVLLIPAWLKHASDVGLTVIDLIAPFFIFAIGLTFGLSFRRRAERDGPSRAYAHSVTRFLAILGIGALVSAGETAFGLNPSGMDWGVLQAIGAAGLLTLLVIRLPTLWRALLGLVLLVGYQIILDRFLLQQVVQAPHAGLYGSIGWGVLMILSTVLADLFHAADRTRKAFGPAAGAALLAGLALAVWVPVSKHRVSASYVLITLGVSALLFLVFHWLSEHTRWKARLLTAWGKNPLVLYALHYLLIGVVFLPGIPGLYTAAPLWLVLVEIAGLVAAISWVAFWLERHETIISL